MAYFLKYTLAHCCPINMRDMDCVSPPKTVSRMDAGFEPPWMGSRRVFGGDTRFMSLDIYLWDSSDITFKKYKGIVCIAIKYPG